MPAEPHIFFVDDDADIRELVQVILRAAGFRVSVAGDPLDVLKVVAKNRFDAVLLDYWMPRMTGLDLCRRIRTFDQKTPILICSGVFTKADIEAAALAGAQGYLAKPFNAEDLVSAVRAALKPKNEAAMKAHKSTGSK
jgi:DNA-binding response OmpR family regulator